MTEVTGPLAVRFGHVDMSNVRLDDERRTYPAALGVSFRAGSSEDNPALVQLGSQELTTSSPRARLKPVTQVIACSPPLWRSGRSLRLGHRGEPLWGRECGGLLAGALAGSQLVWVQAQVGYLGFITNPAMRGSGRTCRRHDWEMRAPSRFRGTLRKRSVCVAQAVAAMFQGSRSPMRLIG